ncbi:MAG: hypothetical protein M2R46_03114 [Verrucomicrobia subdivision 3 bacterium]|nr:hypothetical protein [Limisphaerales bacterium]
MSNARRRPLKDAGCGHRGQKREGGGMKVLRSVRNPEPPRAGAVGKRAAGKTGRRIRFGAKAGEASPRQGFKDSSFLITDCLGKRGHERSPRFKGATPEVIDASSHLIGILSFRRQLDRVLPKLYGTIPLAVG